MNSNENKTPLEYYERAIQELTNTREQLQTELEILREIQTSYQTLKDELATTKAKLDDNQRELSNTKQELQQTTEFFEQFNRKMEAQVNYCYSETQNVKIQINSLTSDISARCLSLNYQKLKYFLENIALRAGIFTS